jgi:hypothetical protein
MLSVYSIDPVSGVPTQISGSPFEAASASPLAIDPSGNFVYFQDSPLWVTDAINFETGVPTGISAASVGVPVGTNILWIAIDPLDRFAALNGNEILSIDPVTGSLIGPQPQNPTSGTSVFDPSGRFLYAQVNYCPLGTACGPAAYQVDPTTGALTPIAGSNFGLLSFSVPIVDPTGRYLYALGSNPSGAGSAIFGFSINQTTGALTPLPSSPLPMTYTEVFDSPMAISFAPTGISNPVPSINSFSPPSVTAAGPAFTLTVNGSNFVPGAKVYFGGRGRVTTYVSSTQLTSSILPSDISFGGTGVVFVFNPLPGGGSSSSAEFPVIDPSPNLLNISTTSVVAGGNGFILTLTGTGFQPISVATVNGTAQTTTFVTFDELQVTITAAEIAIPGTISIGVTTPAINGLGGGTSGTLPLNITPLNLPPPVISQIAPGSATAGGPAFPLLITGVGFASNSIVTFGSAQVPVTGFSSSGNGMTLVATIPASAITVPGTKPVVVSTAAGISPAVTFIIENPPPTAGGVSPPVVPAGSAALTLNVTGANFVTGSTVLVNGASRVTTFVNSALLQAMLLASDISHGGTLTITVSSPGPGGGLSAAITLAIADYSVSVRSSTASVSAGNVASYSLTIAPSNGAYTNPVTFTASGLPAGASASFSSPTVTPGANPTNFTLSISTMSRSSISPRQTPEWPMRAFPLTCLVGLAFAFWGINLCALKTRLRGLAPQFLLAILVVMAASLMACSSSPGGASAPPDGSATGTPAGTYSVVVTAASGTDVHTATVTLTVM